jgi:hypothetical protein
MGKDGIMVGKNGIMWDDGCKVKHGQYGIQEENMG